MIKERTEAGNRYMAKHKNQFGELRKQKLIKAQIDPAQINQCKININLMDPVMNPTNLALRHS